jgi:hypothetical protein
LFNLSPLQLPRPTHSITPTLVVLGIAIVAVCMGIIVVLTQRQQRAG